MAAIVNDLPMFGPNGDVESDGGGVVVVATSMSSCVVSRRSSGEVSPAR